MYCICILNLSNKNQEILREYWHICYKIGIEYYKYAKTYIELLQMTQETVTSFMMCIFAFNKARFVAVFYN